MNREAIMLDARNAGTLERYHTWPVSHRQTVGEHCWQQMRIWYLIWGDMPPHISTYILWSDAGELKTGDVPFPLKANNPDLKRIFDRLEAQHVVDMGGRVPELNEEEKLRVKVCDLIEMLEFGLTERRRGNQYAEPIVKDCRTAVIDKMKGLTPPNRARLSEYMRKADPGWGD